MTPSKQSVAHRRATLITLRQATKDLPVQVTDAGPGLGFAIHWVGASAEASPALRARYEVVRAWIAGYRAARVRMQLTSQHGVDQVNDQIQAWVNEHEADVPKPLAELLGLLDLVLNDL